MRNHKDFWLKAALFETGDGRQSFLVARREDGYINFLIGGVKDRESRFARFGFGDNAQSVDIDGVGGEVEVGDTVVGGECRCRFLLLSFAQGLDPFVLPGFIEDNHVFIVL